MNESIRSLSEAEIDGVAGGLQSPGGSKSLVVMPDPGFVIGTASPDPQSSNFSWGVDMGGTFL